MLIQLYIDIALWLLQIAPDVTVRIVAMGITNFVNCSSYGYSLSYCYDTASAWLQITTAMAETVATANWSGTV